jgi:hypothetical protein
MRVLDRRGERNPISRLELRLPRRLDDEKIIAGIGLHIDESLATQPLTNATLGREQWLPFRLAGQEMLGPDADSDPVVGLGRYSSTSRTVSPIRRRAACPAAKVLVDMVELNMRHHRPRIDTP